MAGSPARKSPVQLTLEDTFALCRKYNVARLRMPDGLEVEFHIDDAQPGIPLNGEAFPLQEFEPFPEPSFTTDVFALPTTSDQ
jgi:hypothetical protein